MKKIIYFLVIAIGLGWLIFTFKDKAAKNIVEKAIAARTGLKPEIDSLNMGLVKTELTIRDLRLFNPVGYQEPVMLHIPYVYLDYNFADLLKKNIHIENMELDLKDFFVIKDKSGKFNLYALMPASTKETASKAGPKGQAQAPVPFKIDNLLLKIGKVTYKDYSKDPNNPMVSEFNLNFKGKYSNIADMRSLVELIVGKAIFDTAFDKLANLVSGGLETTAQELNKSLKPEEKK